MAITFITPDDNSNFASSISYTKLLEFSLNSATYIISATALVQPAGVGAIGTLSIRLKGDATDLRTLDFTETVYTKKPFAVYTATAGVYELWAKVNNQQYAILVSSLELDDGAVAGAIVETQYIISSLATLDRPSSFRRNRQGIFEIKKDSQTTLDFVFDFSAQLSAGETISSYQFTSEVQGALTFNTTSLASPNIYAKITGSGSLVGLKVTTSTGRVFFERYLFLPTFYDSLNRIYRSDYGL